MVLTAMVVVVVMVVAMPVTTIPFQPDLFQKEKKFIFSQFPLAQP